ncbi:MAG: STAS-like domain-containing protein [Candidatus Marinimicrobia bacterium]|nr:STAS-like domain-containing protein [Candidatus Neomarinimicrobiota bacterium]MCF7829948.1 STAS-like domain-containing protein [Candidatus Neomarinimicrobiota bacterium]MCF7881898.1 STAS-like domain-containing protein [Candidatus Neomarinimicrobiota bacterium]
MSIEIVNMKEYSDYLGTEVMGQRTRRKIAGLWESSEQIVCNFDDVLGMTGAYADEAFGKMFIEKGSSEYVEKVRFENLNDLVKTILKCTLYQRYDQMQGGWRL